MIAKSQQHLVTQPQTMRVGRELLVLADVGEAPACAQCWAWAKPLARTLLLQRGPVPIPIAARQATGAPYLVL